MEQIYTIPVNEAFESCQANGCDCPLCRLYDMLEKKEVDMSLGSSMMEPSIRMEMNEKGFCRDHFSKMLEKNNRLSLALILESHLPEVKGKLNGGFFVAFLSTCAENRIKKSAV